MDSQIEWEKIGNVYRPCIRLSRSQKWSQIDEEILHGLFSVYTLLFTNAPLKNLIVCQYENKTVLLF